MKGLKVFNYMRIKRILMCIVWFLIYSFFCRGQQAWPQSADIRPFEATLEIIQQVDPECDSPPTNTAKLTFGFADPGNRGSESLAPAPPPPPQYCLDAHFDPNYTTVDGEYLNFSQGFGWGWKNAVVHIPDEKASWGIRIMWENKPGAVIPFNLRWDPNQLIRNPGQFILSVDEPFSSTNMSPIDMRTRSQAPLEARGEEILLTISYSSSLPNPPQSDNSSLPQPDHSVLCIICVGGGPEEVNLEGQLGNFQALGIAAYKFLTERDEFITSEENINWIAYNYDINRYLSLDPNRNLNKMDQKPHQVTSYTGRSQKDALKKAITEWTMDKWASSPKKPVLIIYLVDHGSISAKDKNTSYIELIGSNLSDTNERRLYPEELESWLDTLDNALGRQCEVITIVEACYSTQFVAPLSQGTATSRFFIASAEDKADVSVNGTAAFSYHLLQGIRDGKTLHSAYSDAVYQLVSKSSTQKPCYSDSRNPDILSTPTGFAPSLTNFPVIKKIALPDKIGFGVAPFTATIDSDRPVKKVWAEVAPLGCTNEQCRWSTDPNNYKCDGNQCTFSIYNMFGIYGYEVYVYAKDGMDRLSPPYFFKIPASPRKVCTEGVCVSPPPIEDDFEPDNDRTAIEGETCLIQQSQLHSFHNSNDVDWVAFYPLPESEEPDSEMNVYEIRLLPLDQSAIIDPNTRTFQATIFTDKGESTLTLKPKRSSLEYCYGHQVQIPNAIAYYVDWSNKDKILSLTFLKIQPTAESPQFLPYELTIDLKSTAESSCHVWFKLNKGFVETLDLRRGDNFYLLDNIDDNSNRFDQLKWVENAQYLYCMFNPLDSHGLLHNPYGIYINGKNVKSLDIKSGQVIDSTFAVDTVFSD